MILLQDEAGLIEYEKEFSLLYFERRGPSTINFRQTIKHLLEVIEKEQVRFWLINASGANPILYEDQVWLIDQLDHSFYHKHSLEKVALVPPLDTYTMMATESILEHMMGKTHFEFQYFSDLAAARDWLEESFREPCFYDEGLEIEYDAYHHWIYANWKGNHDFASIKRGCELVVDLLVAKNCHRLLNDNRLSLGTWSDASHWIVTDWLPRLEQLQVKAIGWILSPSSLHRTDAMQVFNSLQTSIKVEVFNNVSDAREWLQAH